MTDLRRNVLVYLAALFSISEIVLADVLHRRIWASVHCLAPVFGLLGLGLVCAAMSALHRHGGRKSGQSYLQTTRVVDRGPYAVVRHPQYLGYMCLNVTFMFISQHGLIIVLGSLAMMLFYLYALREEEALTERFGREYQAYMRRAPRVNLALGLTRTILRWRSAPESEDDAHPLVGGRR
jgi:protein-S-isoprenylcysteine O-methyltransferase Ste14